MDIMVPAEWFLELWGWQKYVKLQLITRLFSFFADPWILDLQLQFHEKTGYWIDNYHMT